MTCWCIEAGTFLDLGLAVKSVLVFPCASGHHLGTGNQGKVFAEALQEARPGCLLATNTLSLSLKSIQEAGICDC